MTIQSCGRCGQLLLPEIVRELGDGRRCPFCNADLKVGAKADAQANTQANSKATAKPNTMQAASPPARQPARAISGVQPPARAPSAVPPPAAPAARAQIQVATPPRLLDRPQPPAAPSALAVPSRAAPTLPGMSAARTQTAAAAAVVLAPSIPEPDTAPNPALAFAPTLESVAAAHSRPVPAPLFALASSSPPWLVTLRRRPRLAVPLVLALLVTIGLVVAHRPRGPTAESSMPAPKAGPPPAVVIPSASPVPPAPAKVTPDSRNRIAAADRPVAAQETAVPSGGLPKATGHAKAGTRSHAAHRTHRQKRHTARPSRGKQTRLAAAESAAAPKAGDDDRTARVSYERGNQRLLTGDTAAAISAYQEAVQSAPGSPSGYRGLGLAYEKEGKIAEAVRAFRHYLKLAPRSGDRDLVARRLRHLLRPGGDPGK